MNWHFASVEEFAVFCEQQARKAEERKGIVTQVGRGTARREVWVYRDVARILRNSNLINFVEKVEEPGDDHG